MEIRIETTFLPLILAHKDLPEGVTLTHQPIYERRDFGYVAIATGILIFASNVTASILGTWICDKIKKVKDKPEFTIKINERIVRQYDENSIIEMIQREIDVSKK